MSTLQATNLKHNASASNNIVLDSSGNATVANNLSFNSGYGSSAVAYGCRAWVNFNGTGTVAIRASGNVSSITDNGGSGDYTVNFTTAMPDADYGFSVSASNSASNSVTIAYSRGHTTAPTASSFRIGTTNDAGTAIDMPFISVAIFR